MRPPTRSRLTQLWLAQCRLIEPLLETLQPYNSEAIEGYEAQVRLVSEAYRSTARILPLAPARTLATATADFTRDVGAVQASSARWLLRA